MSVAWTNCAQHEYELVDLITASEARVSERVPIRCWAKLSFETEGGKVRIIRGRVLNMSTSGVLVEALRPFAVGSQVRIQANELLVGTAYVRHCTRRSWRFNVGLEFAKAVRDRY